MVRREPHVLVGEAEIVAHLQQDHAGDRIDLGGERSGPCCSRSTSRTGTLMVEVDLAGLDGRDARGRILDDVEGDAADLRLGSPIVFVALKHDAGVELVLDELVGTGADRLLAEGVGTDQLPCISSARCSCRGTPAIAAQSARAS